MKYNKNTIEFLKGWDINPKQNEQRIAQKKSNELSEIYIGCDTGKRKTTNCHDEHKDFSYTDWIRTCRLCESALSKLDVINMYDIKREKIIFTVNTKSMNEELEKQRTLLEARKTEEARAKTKAIANETVENKNPCRKCGYDMNKCGSEDGMYCMDCYTEDY